MPILQQSCCGCSLEKGSRCIAIYFLICRCIVILLSIISYKSLDGVLDDVSQCVDNRYIFGCLDNDEMERLRSVISTVRGILLFNIIMCAILLVMDSLLLYGVNTKRRSFMLPWIIVESISLVANLALGILSFTNQSAYINITANTVFTLVGIAIAIYLELVVISHYQQLGDPNAQIPPPTVTVHTYPVGIQQNPAVQVYAAYPNQTQGVIYPNQTQGVIYPSQTQGVIYPNQTSAVIYPNQTSEVIYPNQSQMQQGVPNAEFKQPPPPYTPEK